LYRERSGGSGTGSTTGVFGGRVVGTPGYMAPEQAVGNISSYDPSTDVYGLGGILYFIPYGGAPNQGEERGGVLAASWLPKRKGILRQGIFLRGQRVQKVMQDAIEVLESICLKALMPEQKDRHPTVEALIVDVKEWLSASTTRLAIGGRHNS